MLVQLSIFPYQSSALLINDELVTGGVGSVGGVGGVGR